MTEEPLWESLWLKMTKMAYYMANQRGEDKLKYRYVDEIAKNLLENLPNSAHLYALERINTVGELQTEMWRQALIELDKLQGENNARDND